MPNLTVGVLGAGGHIGLVQAAALASLGYSTIGYDLDLGRVRAVSYTHLDVYKRQGNSFSNIQNYNKE